MMTTFKYFISGVPGLVSAGYPTEIEHYRRGKFCAGSCPDPSFSAYKRMRNAILIEGCKPTLTDKKTKYLYNYGSFGLEFPSPAYCRTLYHDFYQKTFIGLVGCLLAAAGTVTKFVINAQQPQKNPMFNIIYLAGAVVSAIFTAHCYSLYTEAKKLYDTVPTIPQSVRDNLLNSVNQERTEFYKNRFDEWKKICLETPLKNGSVTLWEEEYKYCEWVSGFLKEKLAQDNLGAEIFSKEGPFGYAFLTDFSDEKNESIQTEELRQLREYIYYTFDWGWINVYKGDPMLYVGTLEEIPQTKEEIPQTKKNAATVENYFKSLASLQDIGKLMEEKQIHAIAEKICEFLNEQTNSLEKGDLAILRAKFRADIYKKLEPTSPK